VRPRALEHLGGEIVGGHVAGGQLHGLLQEFHEPAPLNVPGAVHCIGVGSGAGEGQVVRPGDLLLAAEGQQPQDGGVLVVLLAQQAGVEGQIEGLAVGHQRLAVAVRDDPPGGGHRLLAGDGAHGLLPVLRPVDNLRVVEHADVKAQKYGEKAPQKGQAEGAGPFLIRIEHENLPEKDLRASAAVRRCTAASSQ
jgi:hypothetical protein